MNKKRNRCIHTLVWLAMLLFLGSIQASAYVPRVRLSPTSATLSAGRTKTLYLRGTGADVRWSSSDPAVASVLDEGKIISTTSRAVVTAKKAGSTVITATADGKTYTCKITVKGQAPSLSDTKLTLRAGRTKTLKVKNAPAAVVWKSSNKAVATVSSRGKVTAKKAGTAVITARTGGKKLICKVTVRKSSSSAGTGTASGTANLNKLGKYLSANGKKDEEGDRCIQSASGGCTYRITYSKSKGKFYFYAYIKKGAKHVYMNVSVPNSAASVVVTGPSFGAYGASAVIRSGSYRRGSVPVFTSADGYGQAAGAAGLQAAFVGWDSLLKKKTGLKMSDIGFSSWH